MTKSSAAVILLLATFSVRAADLLPTPVWTDPDIAMQDISGFFMVGEYLSKEGKTALQTTLLKGGDFLTATYLGGLPGAGWDKSPIKSEKLNPEVLTARLRNYTKTERKSPTLRKPAPSDAVLVFPDGFTNIEDGLMLAGGKTVKDLGSFHMHLEFMQPLKPGKNPSNQDRGNSGIYIFNNYEIQIIDTFALDYENPENNAIETESINKQWCGALYKMKRPDVNMTYPPLRWQTYDIDFTAPEFDGDQKVKNARITVLHNGVMIHNDVELKAGTGNGAKRPQLATGPIFFQNHHSPVVFRNIWATELNK